MATKILLADDSITIQKVVELTFSEGEFEVQSVGNGVQALEKIREWTPDIAILDVIMPEKSGYEVCHEIRHHPDLQHLPVLLLTGTFEPFDPERAHSAGANGHITKPFESRTLIAKVEELLAARSEPATGAGVAARPAERVDETADSGERVDPGGSGRREADAAPMVSASVPAAGRETPDWTADDFGQEFPTATEIEQGFGRTPRWEAASGQPDPLIGSAAAAATPAAGLSLGQEAGGESGTTAVEEEVGSARFGRTMAIPIAPGAAGEEGPSAVTPVPPADFGTSRPEPSTAPPPAGSEFESDPVPSPTPAGSKAKGIQLSQESIDTIARQVVEKLTDQVVREIAWEVVPDLAETLIRKRIQELEDQIEES